MEYQNQTVPDLGSPYGKLKERALSGVFLSGAVMVTIVTAWNVIAYFVSLGLAEISFNMASNLLEWMLPYNMRSWLVGLSLAIGFLILVPQILNNIGIWMFRQTVIGEEAPVNKKAGMNLIKAAAVMNLIYVLLVALTMIMMVILFVQGAATGMPVNNPLFPIFIFLLIFAVLAMALIYQIQLMRLSDGIKSLVMTGSSPRGISLYIIVVNYVLAAVQLVLCFGQQNVLQILMNLVAAAAMICLTIALQSLRSALQQNQQLYS